VSGGEIYGKSGTPHNNFQDKPARIEIVEWRVLFDDEDSLDLMVFGAGDTTDEFTVIAEKYKGSYPNGEIVFDYEDPDDHPDKDCATVITNTTILDGALIESHDGRKFRVNITEVTNA
jgi:hypothetical protein